MVKIRIHPKDAANAKRPKIDHHTSITSAAGIVSKGGRPPIDPEQILLAVLFRMREGCSWKALSIFAPHTTIYTRWKAWCESGVWDQILDALAGSAAGKLWAIDSTCSKVHKHAFGGPQSVDLQSIGRSKGGANTKIHALVDSRGRGVRILLGAGNRHDIKTAPELVAGQNSRTILADKDKGKKPGIDGLASLVTPLARFTTSFASRVDGDLYLCWADMICATPR